MTSTASAAPIVFAPVVTVAVSTHGRADTVGSGGPVVEQHRLTPAASRAGRPRS
jgi:hypothetical protein